MSSANAHPPTIGILAVCTANICRSPGIERLLALELSRRPISDGLRIKIGSAGVKGWTGSPMDPSAASALAQLGGSPEGFLSRPLARVPLQEQDLVLTAGSWHRSAFVAESPTSLRQTFTIKEFAYLSQMVGPHDSVTDLVAAAYVARGATGLSDIEIADPYNGTAEMHAKIMREIHQAVVPVAEAIARCVAA